MTKLTKDDYTVLAKIAARAEKLSIVQHSRMTLLMDLEYTNEETPLDFNRLLNADDFNFAHDIIGIQSHFNRVTKKMENCFLPRFAKQN